MCVVENESHGWGKWEGVERLEGEWGERWKVVIFTDLSARAVRPNHSGPGPHAPGPEGRYDRSGRGGVGRGGGRTHPRHYLSNMFDLLRLDCETSLHWPDRMERVDTQSLHFLLVE